MFDFEGVCFAGGQRRRDPQADHRNGSSDGSRRHRPSRFRSQSPAGLCPMPPLVITICSTTTNHLSGNLEKKKNLKKKKKI